jgi:hypothetical protein
MMRRALLAALLGLLALPAMAQSNDPSFRIVNNTPNVINEVYASPSSQQTWGHDRLGTEVVPPGGKQVIRLPQDGNCVYDVRIVFQNGKSEERRNLNTCGVADLVLGGGAAAPRQAQQGNPSFNLLNRSGRPIEEFYASPASQQSWGPDRLGDSTVAPGANFAVRLPQGECNYDLRWVWEGGESQERRGVNACTLVNYVVR